MKRIGFLLLASALLIASAVAAFGGEADEEWRRYVASPSYGLSLTMLDLEYQIEGKDDKELDTYVMPGIDLRHFNGVNVTPAGGFFYGYEIAIGIMLRGQGAEYDTFPDDDEEGPYRLENAMAVGLRLLLKHGYRFPVATEGRVDLGVELGLGVSAGLGGIRIQDLSEGGGSISHFSESIGPAFEVGFEGGYRATDHFRYVARLGVQGGAPMLVASEENLEFIGISATTIPVMFTLRFGFTRDH